MGGTAQILFFATGSYSIHRFNILLWERFHSTYRNGVSATNKRANPKLFLRSRLKSEYNIPDISLKPYVSVEFYNPLNDPIENTMNKIRWKAGSTHRINIKHEIELY